MPVRRAAPRAYRRSSGSAGGVALRWRRSNRRRPSRLGDTGGNSLAALARLLDGSELVAVGGMHMHGNPMELIRHVIRLGKPDKQLLTSPSGSLASDLLIGTGLVKEVLTSYIGFEHLGLAPCFRRRVESGELRV